MQFAPPVRSGGSRCLVPLAYAAHISLDRFLG